MFSYYFSNSLFFLLVSLTPPPPHPLGFLHVSPPFNLSMFLHSHIPPSFLFSHLRLPPFLSSPLISSFPPFFYVSLPPPIFTSFTFSFTPLPPSPSSAVILTFLKIIFPIFGPFFNSTISVLSVYSSHRSFEVNR